MKNRPIIILAIIVLAICGVAVWYLQTQPSKAAPLPPAATTSAVPEVTSTGPSVPAVPKTRSAEAAKTAPGKPAEPATPMAEWETKIDQVLRSNVPEKETAQLLINMLPTLPPEGQEEAAQHISNLISDEDYKLVQPLVKNASLPEDVLDVFVTDLMNRDDSVKLPTLLDIAKMPNHPHHEEAISDLQIFLDDDYGTDWNKWDAATKAYLKKQAEESAADAATPPTK